MTISCKARHIKEYRSFKWKFQVKFETTWHGLVPSGCFQVASVPLMLRVLTPECVQATFSSFKLTRFEAVHPPTRKKLFADMIYTTPNSPHGWQYQISELDPHPNSRNMRLKRLKL